MDKALGQTPQNDQGVKRSESLPSVTKERFLEIDRAKGLGIILVVWGHLATAATPGLPLWFYISVDAIYSFHMPLFMYLSGFVFFLSKSHERFWTAPATFAWKRFDRLMVPCIAFGVLIVVGKAMLLSSGRLEEAVEILGEGLKTTLVNGPGNPVLSIWYLIVLFAYSLLVPVFSRFLPRPSLALIVIGLLLWLVEIPEEFYLERIAQYLVFFAIGGCVATYRHTLLQILRAWYLPALFFFAFLCVLLLGSELALLFCGIASLPAIHGLFMQKFWESDRLFLFLGQNSMAIYLINTIAIGVGQIIYTRFLPYQGEWFLLYSPILFLVGLLVPIVIRRFLGVHPGLRHVKKYLD